MEELSPGDMKGIGGPVHVARCVLGAPTGSC